MDNRINILVIEDEYLAYLRLEKKLMTLDFPLTISKWCDSIENSIAYLNMKTNIDLIIMDIRLGDGLSLEIFDKININIPIIFTTAYDEYMMKAFKFHSVDYLLKPIDEVELNFAFSKFYNLYYLGKKESSEFEKLITLPANQGHKERYLVKNGNQIVVVSASEISYFYTQDGYSHIMTFNGKKYLIDDSLDLIQKNLDSTLFFRINRSIILSLKAIQKVETYVNSRYIVSLNPTFHEKAIVSRERVKVFKEWLDQ